MHTMFAQGYPIMETKKLSHCRPVLKWAGGKRQLLPAIINNMPDHFNKYYEPFLGGAALLISLYSLGKLGSCIISDINRDIFNLYVNIRENPQRFIDEMNNLKFRNSKEDYYEARNLFNSTQDPLTRSVLFIYLNRHGYNGLYRVNSRNEFNVPFGRYNNPSMPSGENILAMSEILQSCTILNSDFEIAVSNAKSGDFVYFDPPYMPLNRTSYFTSYTSSGFNARDQERLAEVFIELTNRGVYVMESNANSHFIRELYRDFHLLEVDARRNINSVGADRGKIKELIITNYEINKGEKQIIKNGI